MSGTNDFRLIPHQNSKKENVQKFDLNFWTHLEIIEVFATVFLVFRIYLIFQNVNKPTYFRFFSIA